MEGGHSQPRELPSRPEWPFQHCDQMAILFFILGHLYQYKFAQKLKKLPKILPNTKLSFQILTDWRNFTKSGHTAFQPSTLGNAFKPFSS